MCHAGAPRPARREPPGCRDERHERVRGGWRAVHAVRDRRRGQRQCGRVRRRRVEAREPARARPAAGGGALPLRGAQARAGRRGLQEAEALVSASRLGVTPVGPARGRSKHGFRGRALRIARSQSMSGWPPKHGKLTKMSK